MKFSELKEGLVMTGKVRRLMMVHGIQIDLGAEVDGCATRLPAPSVCVCVSV